MATPLAKALVQFKALYKSLKGEDKEKFAALVFQEMACSLDDSLEDELDGYQDSIEDQHNDDSLLDDPVGLINVIANDLKTKLPKNAVLKSETIVNPSTGKNADCLPDFTVHVDEFLYDDEEVEKLVEDGQLQRYYCKDCQSRNIEPLIFLSHSMSRDFLYYIFNDYLPTIENKTVLDVGSRLGAVLYGAFLYTDASRIIGVEMNEELCKIQRETIKKYKMTDRVEVVHSRIEEVPEIVSSSDIIVLNNVFEFYMSESEQLKCWEFLKRHVKPKTILITQPPLETTFRNLKPGFETAWVKPYSPQGAVKDECCEISFYEVL